MNLPSLPHIPHVNPKYLWIGGAVVLAGGGLYILYNRETGGAVADAAPQTVDDVLGGGGYGVGQSGIGLPGTVSPYLATYAGTSDSTTPTLPGGTTRTADAGTAQNGTAYQTVINALTGSDPVAAAVSLLYQKELGRPTDLGGLLVQTNEIENNGASLQNIAYNIAKSPEYLALHPNLTGADDQNINALYESIIGRSADAAGLAVQKQAISSGQITYDQLKTNLYNSAEYKALHPNG